MTMKLQICTIKKIPKLVSNHTCLAVITLDFSSSSGESDEE